MRTNQNKYIKVAAHKKNCIKGIIRIAEKCNYIDQIIVFGSTLETRCKRGSDIDLAIVSNVTGSRLYRTTAYRDFKRNLYDLDEEQTYDVLQFHTRSSIEKSHDHICREILNKGKVIFQRDDVNV
ncbi:MAG: nucleotidyltransferase domain-containing protein [Lachnospiraceae bacterium]|nr:nucleotidyltransferase domain-containing protein [Lachnospiraceae bacterium]